MTLTLEKFETCPNCNTKLTQHGYDSQLCDRCAWSRDEDEWIDRDITKKLKELNEMVADQRPETILRRKRRGDAILAIIGFMDSLTNKQRKRLISALEGFNDAQRPG